MNTNLEAMEGIMYLTDEENNKKYVQIDLEKYGELIEDLLDILIAESRKDDEKISLEQFTSELKAEGLL